MHAFSVGQSVDRVDIGGDDGAIRTCLLRIATDRQNLWRLRVVEIKRKIITREDIVDPRRGELGEADGCGCDLSLQLLHGAMEEGIDKGVDLHLNLRVRPENTE